jgi:hypothetical protein
MAQSYKVAMQLDKRQFGRRRRLTRQQGLRRRCDGRTAACCASTALSWSSVRTPRSPAHSTTTTGTPVARAHDRGLLGDIAARASGNPLAAMPCTYDRSDCGFEKGKRAPGMPGAAGEANIELFSQGRVNQVVGAPVRLYDQLTLICLTTL